MIVIGELINSSRQPVEEAFLNRQADILVDLAIKQQQAGCSYLEVNAATIIDQEDELLKWIIPILQEQVSIPLSIDSPNPRALEAGLKVHKGQALLSSLPGRQAEMEEILPLIRDFRPEVIVSALDESGFPDTPEKIIKIADRILNRLFSTTSLSQDEVYLDLLIRPMAVFPEAGQLFLKSLLLARQEFPGIKTIAGLSNISYGLPRRRLVNLIFLSNLIGHGLSAVIADPLSPDFWAVIIISEYLNNRPGSAGRFLEWARSDRRDD